MQTPTEKAMLVYTKTLAELVGRSITCRAALIVESDRPDFIKIVLMEADSRAIAGRAFTLQELGQTNLTSFEIAKELVDSFLALIPEIQEKQ